MIYLFDRPILLLNGCLDFQWYLREEVSSIINRAQDANTFITGVANAENCEHIAKFLDVEIAVSTVKNFSMKVQGSAQSSIFKNFDIIICVVPEEKGWEYPSIYAGIYYETKLKSGVAALMLNNYIDYCRHNQQSLSDYCNDVRTHLRHLAQTTQKDALKDADDLPTV